MYSSNTVRHALAALACAAAAGCAGVQPVAYSGLASSSSLKPNAQDESGRVPYRYSAPADWLRYSRLIIDPVVVYRGADQQFGDLSEQDRTALAAYMQSEFAGKLKTRFALADAPAPDTLRLKLTLTGATTTTPVLGTFTHIDIGGNLYNAVQAVRGREGCFTGAVFYTVELYDASSGRLLDAYVTKQYPNAMNIGATFGSLSAARTGIDKGAAALLAQLS